MSMMWDRRKQIETIMKKRGASGGEVLAGPAPMKMESVKDEDGVPDGRHAAAQDMMMAMHEKSPEKMAQAMANFVDIHMSKSDEAKPEPHEG